MLNPIDPLLFCSRTARQLKSDSTKPWVDERKLTLNEWLRLALTHEDGRNVSVMDWQFPTDALAEEYLTSVAQRSELEVTNLLRKFLIPGGTLGHDKFILDSWMKNPKQLASAVERTEFAKRLVSPGRQPWEGITWVLDLLPLFPQMAIDSISAYITAHCQFLPDGRWNGLEDAMRLIRARYFDLSHPREILLGLRPRDFEFLVGALYAGMGYEVVVTPASRDGGFDIEAQRNGPGTSEVVLVECKLQEVAVGVEVARALSGVVEARRANKGVIVSPGSFTKPAITWAASVRRLELLNYAGLNKLLNRFLGSDWPLRMDSIISMQKRKQTELRHPS